MRRTLGVTVILLVLAMTATAAADVFQSYKDTFSSGGYSGNDGTLEWASPWYEGNDDGDPSSGVISVSGGSLCSAGKCLNIEGDDEELVESVYVKRYADTTIFSFVELSYEFGRLFETGESGVLYVKVSSDGGSSWATLASYQLDVEDSSPIHASHDISGWASEDFAVRFVATDLTDGEVFIDNVEIKGQVSEGSTTTTTTTTVEETTTTEKPTTTTTEPTTTTTTTEPTTTTTTEPTTTTTSTTTTTPQRTTTTTVSDTTTTTAAAVLVGGDDPPEDSGGPPDGSGLRETAQGIQTNFDGGLFGDVKPMPDIIGVDVGVDYNMAVEVIEASWAWMALLGVVLGWSILSGLERRRAASTTP